MVWVVCCFLLALISSSSRRVSTQLKASVRGNFIRNAVDMRSVSDIPPNTHTSLRFHHTNTNWNDLISCILAYFPSFAYCHICTFLHLHMYICASPPPPPPSPPISRPRSAPLHSIIPIATFALTSNSSRRGLVMVVNVGVDVRRRG